MCLPRRYPGSRNIRRGPHQESRHSYDPPRRRGSSSNTRKIRVLAARDHIPRAQNQRQGTSADRRQSESRHLLPDTTRRLTTQSIPWKSQLLRAKFLPNLSSILSPLYTLFQKNESWNWQEKQEAAFQEAKRMLTSGSLFTIMTPTKSSCSHATPHHLKLGQSCLTKWKMVSNDRLHSLRDLFRKRRKITPTWTKRLLQLCSVCENFTNISKVAHSPYSRTTSHSNTFSMRIEESQQWHLPGYSVGLLH